MSWEKTALPQILDYQDSHCQTCNNPLTFPSTCSSLPTPLHCPFSLWILCRLPSVLFMSSYPVLFQYIILMEERSASKLLNLSNANNQPIPPPTGNLCLYSLIYFLRSLYQLHIYGNSWPTEINVVWCEHSMTGNNSLWHILWKDLRLYSHWKNFQQHSYYQMAQNHSTF